VWGWDIRDCVVAAGSVVLDLSHSLPRTTAFPIRKTHLSVKSIAIVFESEMSFTLLVSDCSLCVKNLEVVAALALVSLKVKAGVSTAETEGHGLLLQTPSGESITDLHAMFKALSSAAAVPDLFGGSPEDEEHVLHWLDVSFNANILPTLPILEAQLNGRTFLVGERVSAADVSVYTQLVRAVATHEVDLRRHKSVLRWFMTIGHHSTVAGVCPLPAGYREVSSSSSSSAAAALGSGSGSASSKWDRHRIRVKELLADGNEVIGSTVTVKGWMRTSRSAG
jgi:hypothetical protein